MKILALVCIAAASLMPATQVSAHHSFAMFDQNKKVKIAGTVKELDWTNPHAWLYVTAPDAQGRARDYAIEMGSLAQIARGGWRKDTVKPGDRVTVEIHPLKDGSRGGQFLFIDLPNGRKLGQVVTTGSGRFGGGRLDQNLPQAGGDEEALGGH